MSQRLTVVNKIKQLAPIIASRNIKLEGLSEAELRNLHLCLQHIDTRIRAAEQKARQPWRLGR